MGYDCGIPAFEQLEERQLLSVSTLAFDDFSLLDSTGEWGWSSNDWTFAKSSESVNHTLALNESSYTPAAERPSIRIQGSGADSSTIFDSYIERDIDLSNMTEAKLVFDWYGYSVESAGTNDFGVAFWNGSSWDVQLSFHNTDSAKQLTGTGWHTDHEYTIASTYHNADFKIRFFVDEFDGSDWFFIDNVEIQGDAAVPDPSASTEGIIASDDFALAGGNEYGWAQDDWDIQSGTNVDHSVAYSRINIAGSGVITREVDLSEVGGAELTMTYLARSAYETGEYFEVSMSADGGTTWETLADYNMDANYDDDLLAVPDTSYTTTIAIPQSLLSDTHNAILRITNNASIETLEIRDITINTSITDTPSTPDLSAADDSGNSDTDNVTNQTSGLTFTVPTSDGYTVRLYSVATDGTKTLLDSGTATGNSLAFDIALAEGIHNIAATQQDVGNSKGESPLSDTLEVTVDTTAPSSPGWFNTDDHTSTSATPYLQGVAHDEDEIQPIRLYEGQTLLATTNTDLDGNWTISTPDWISGVSLSDGVHVLTFTATDVAGNESGPSYELSVTVDTVAPTVASTLINGGSSQRNSIDSIGFTFSETIATQTTMNMVGISAADLTIKWYNESTSSWDEVDISGATFANNTWDVSGLLSNNGHYVAILDDAFTDIAGNYFDGDNDGSAGGDYVFAFHLLEGDMNGDMVQTSEDIDSIFDMIEADSTDLNADLDGDLDADTDDVDKLVENIFQTFYGDFNFDGQVNSADETIFDNNNGSTNTTWATGDANGDGNTDSSDYSIFSLYENQQNSSFSPITLSTAPTYP